MCNICRQNPCSVRCPNYTPPNTNYYCSFCGEGIYEGEQYIENLNGEHRHYDCFYNFDDLLEWLGYEVKILKENY